MELSLAELPRFVVGPDRRLRGVTGHAWALGAGVLLWLLVAAPGAYAQTPLSTAFTYQGRILDGGVAPPAGTTYDLQFKLFNALVAGAQIGATQTFDNVAVGANGVFTVSLDFGAQYDGTARFLELGVHPGAQPVGNPYTVLAPRQELTGTPYALGIRLTQPEAVSSASAALNITNNGTGNAASFDGPDNNGTTAALRVSSGSQVMLFDGNEIDSLDAGGIFLENNTSFNVVLANGGGNVGVGNSSPLATLTVAANTVAAYANTPGASNCFVSHASTGCDNAACQNLVCSVDSFCCATQWDGVCAGEAGTFCHGHVGIGTTAPGAKLQIVGGTDSEPGAGGFLVLGDTGGANISFDNNEIMARSNGATSTLFLNNDGGDVFIGGNLGVGVTPSAHIHAAGSVALDRGAVYGVQNAGSTGGAGVFGLSTLSQGNGVIGEANVGSAAFGVWGMSSSGDAGHFSGDVDVVGALSKNSGSFKIDHPLDPANKYLYHSFVESPDMMNVYNGNVVTDQNGYATVTLPNWFGVLNRDFRYQLTVLDDANSDAFVMAKVVGKIAHNQFTIRSSAPNVEVSWQVTGIRQDAWANAHRIQVEVDKPDYERGFYRNPELYGQPQSQKIEEASHPGSMTHPQAAEPTPANADAEAPAAVIAPVRSER